MKSKSNLCLVKLSDKLLNKKLNNFEKKKMEGYTRLVQYRIRRKNKQDN